MEKRINIKIDDYFANFKNDIKKMASQVENVNQLLQFVYDYDKLIITTEDITIPKKITTPLSELCCAKKSAESQCGRRKKTGEKYCAIHMKALPFGSISSANQDTTKKVEVWGQDINGIIYYIDKSENVYLTEDIISNKIDPKIIGKYSISNTNDYSIHIL